MRFMLVLLLVIPGVALAQQQVVAPSQLAIQIDNAVGVLAQEAEHYKAEAEAAEKQISELKKQVEELKRKDDK